MAELELRPTTGVGHGRGQGGVDLPAGRRTHEKPGRRTHEKPGRRSEGPGVTEARTGRRTPGACHVARPGGVERR